MTDKELEHYGILGMKWGIRRTPEQLGRHKIKKGTKAYRIQGKGSTGINGLTIVAYLPPDRAGIRGVEARLRNEKKGAGGRSREVTYKLTEDLNVPSREELKLVYKQLMDDPKIREASFRSYVNDLLSTTSAKKFYKKKYGDEAKVKRYEALEKKTSEYLEEYGSYTSDELFDKTAEMMVIHNPIWQKAVVKKLKSRGYNAIVDETVIDSYGVQDGLERIIIFDGETSLREVSSKELSDRDITKADKKYKDWRREANA